MNSRDAASTPAAIPLLLHRSRGAEERTPHDKFTDTIANNELKAPSTRTTERRIIETVAMRPSPEKAAGDLKRAVVFVAPFDDKKAKLLRAQAEAAGAKVVDALTPNVDILIGDDDNRLVQEAHDFEVSVWSVADFITATAGAAPPPPPPGNNDQFEFSKKTMYVRRFPALAGDVVCNNGAAAPLAYSWMTGATSAEMERDLRFLLGAADGDSLRLLNSTGREVPIASGIPHGTLFTVQIVPTTPSAPPPMERCAVVLPDQSIWCYSPGQCSTSPRPDRRSLRSAIHKRKRDQGQRAHKPTKKHASASAVVMSMATETGSRVEGEDKRDEEKEGRASDKARETLDPLDNAHHEEAMRKLVSEAVAMKSWAMREDTPKYLHNEDGSKNTVEMPEATSPENVESSVEHSSPPGGVAAAGKAKLRKLVDSAKVVIKKVSDTVAAVQKSSSSTKPSARAAAATEREMTPQSRLRAADAVRSARKQAAHWLPSRPGRSDATTPLKFSTPV